MRCKRNTDILLTAPIDDAGDGTVYIYPANLFQSMGNVSTGLNSYQLKQFDSSGARKLRTLALGVASGAPNSTLTNVTFNGTENLEKLYVANFTNIYGDLDLSDSPGLQYLDARDSNFSSVIIANNAPIETILLKSPSSLNLSNLSKLKPLSNPEGLMQDWGPLYYVYLTNIDNSGINSKDNILDPAFNHEGNGYETLYFANADEFNADTSDKFIKTANGEYQRVTVYDPNVSVYYKQATKLKGYLLTGVKWKLTNAADIDASTKTIGILEKLKRSDTIVNDERIDPADALEGTMEVKESAYNGNSAEALEIYEKYACSPGSARSEKVYNTLDEFKADPGIKYSDSNYTHETTTYVNSDTVYYVEEIIKPQYPNLDINFTGSNATLYTVNIYDGDGILFWSRKINPNGLITADFLKYGPDGRFRSADIQKTVTAQHEYKFLNTWIIKNDAQVEVDRLTNSAEPMYAKAITQNLHFYPQFDSSIRKYTIDIKSKHPKTKVIEVLRSQKFEFGTDLATVINGVLPYADSSSLDDFAAYDFKGYTLVEDGSNLVSSNFTVTGEATLWAFYKEESDIRKIIHPEYFSAELYTYKLEAANAGIPGKDSALYGDVVGLKISPNPAYTLRGKIVIPAEMTYAKDGKVYPVICITGFKAANVTHVFMESNKASNLLEVDANAFMENTTLKYFDFVNSSIRHISSQAFQKCTNLQVTGFGNKLIYIEQYAFNGGLGKTAGTTIMLPSSIRQIGPQAFSYLKVKGHCMLQLGSAETPCLLNLTEGVNLGANNVFVQNTDQKFSSITFYTSLKTTNTREKVDSFFAGALMGTAKVDIV